MSAFGRQWPSRKMVFETTSWKGTEVSSAFISERWASSPSLSEQQWLDQDTPKELDSSSDKKGVFDNPARLNILSQGEQGQSKQIIMTHVQYDTVECLLYVQYDEQSK